eukprot:928120_1
MDDSKLNVELFRCLDHQDASGLENVLDCGASPNAHKESGWRALHWALPQANPGDGVRDTPTHASCLKVLLARGARISAPDDDGWTALDWCAATGWDKCFAVLMDHASLEDINRKNSIEKAERGESKHERIIHLVAKQGSYANMKRILQSGLSAADLNAQRRDGITALHLVVKHGRVRLLKLLLKEKFIDTSLKTVRGNTPAQIGQYTLARMRNRAGFKDRTRNVESCLKIVREAREKRKSEERKRERKASAASSGSKKRSHSGKSETHLPKKKRKANAKPERCKPKGYNPVTLEYVISIRGRGQITTRQVMSDACARYKMWRERSYAKDAQNARWVTRIQNVPGTQYRVNTSSKSVRQRILEIVDRNFVDPRVQLGQITDKSNPVYTYEHSVPNFDQFGMFATEKIPQNTCLLEYHGVIQRGTRNEIMCHDDSGVGRSFTIASLDPAEDGYCESAQEQSLSSNSPSSKTPDPGNSPVQAGSPRLTAMEDEKSPASTYSDHFVVDAADRFSLGVFVNDARDFARKQTREFNVVFVELLINNWPHYILLTVRDILPGQELLTAYGADYWENHKQFCETREYIADRVQEGVNEIVEKNDELVEQNKSLEERNKDLALKLAEFECRARQANARSTSSVRAGARSQSHDSPDGSASSVDQFETQASRSAKPRHVEPVEVESDSDEMLQSSTPSRWPGNTSYYAQSRSNISNTARRKLTTSSDSAPSLCVQSRSNSRSFSPRGSVHKSSPQTPPAQFRSYMPKRKIVYSESKIPLPFPSFTDDDESDYSMPAPSTSSDDFESPSNLFIKSKKRKRTPFKPSRQSKMQYSESSTSSSKPCPVRGGSPCDYSTYSESGSSGVSRDSDSLPKKKRKVDSFSESISSRPSILIPSRQMSASSASGIKSAAISYSSNNRHISNRLKSYVSTIEACSSKSQPTSTSSTQKLNNSGRPPRPPARRPAPLHVPPKPRRASARKPIISTRPRFQTRTVQYADGRQRIVVE